MLQSVEKEYHLLASLGHTEPHRFLGLHDLKNGQKEIRVFAPHKRELSIELFGSFVSMTPTEHPGLFTLMVSGDVTRFDYQIIYPDETIAFDPYNFSPVVTLVDGHLFQKGVHYKIYEVLGAHVKEHENVEGTAFSVYAPAARQVSLICDSSNWNERVFPMRRLPGIGIWELFLPEIKPGMRYKYSIQTQSGEFKYKSDPFGNQFELRPRNASIVADLKKFCWRDCEWMEKRERSSYIDAPMNIYEMHLGSWLKKKKTEFINYREIASEVVRYVKEMGYTHVELLPITEHPLDESWGYQVTGYFAPTSRYGNLSDLQYFINHLHMHRIGVILDWAPGHFPSDEHGLSQFDGTPLFEKDDPIMGWHPEWNTHIFDYGKKEVSNFLIGSALFWIDKMHIDGLRVDAVESMIHLDYARCDGKWTPNHKGTNENLDAIDFLRHLNNIVHQKYPGVLMIAEDASIYKGITEPVEWEGLGFDLKWNLGWMNDTLSYIEQDPIHRKHHHHDLLRSYQEIYRERYILPISHDEVVYGKKSMLSKMPLGIEEKFAHLRLYYSAALCHPGKKLFFMGTEIAELTEWDCKGELDWKLLRSQRHLQLKRFVRKSNHFYLKNPALWQLDFDPKGFHWIDYSNVDYSIISYLRKGISQQLVCVHNFTPTNHEKVHIPLPDVTYAKEIFNSDSESYGGSNRLNLSIDILSEKNGFHVKIPPLATMIFEVGFDKEQKDH